MDEQPGLETRGRKQDPFTEYLSSKLTDYVIDRYIIGDKPPHPKGISPDAL